MQDLSPATIQAFPTLSFIATQVRGARFAAKQPSWIREIPAFLADYPEHAYGANPRAADKRRALAAARRELAALAADPIASAELEATYRGRAVAA